jgi:hypothetical protein
LCFNDKLVNLYGAVHSCRLVYAFFFYEPGKVGGSATSQLHDEAPGAFNGLFVISARQSGQFSDG